MIETIRLLRNLGQFDSVDSGQQLPCGKLALIYAENGRGKTTLAAVLRSMGNGDPTPILERHRLGATHPPHVVIRGPQNTEAIFQNGAWQRRLADVLVFDDEFVAKNVCAGNKVEINHRYNLHELIIGEQGVTLNARVQEQVRRIEEHNRTIQQKANAIPSTVRGRLNVDEFCALQPQADVDETIAVAQRALEAGRAADNVQRQPEFSSIALPELNLAQVESLLSTQLPDLQTAAADRVQEHLANIGDNGEGWVGEGMDRIDGDQCPFCAQSLLGSPLIAHYQAYFSAAYRELKANINDAILLQRTTHSGTVAAAFERSIAQSSRTQQFWSQFLTIEDIELDTAAITLNWRNAFEAVQDALVAKQAAPLEKIELDDDVYAAITRYTESREAVLQLNKTLQLANREIALVKERAAVANITELERDLTRLLAVRTRFGSEIAQCCNDYLAAKEAKVETEQRREQARRALDAYRHTVFPAYQTTVNRYLQRFNAGFQLARVNSIVTRGGPNCRYTMLINDHEVPLSATERTEHCFKNTMSSGDRNTLALAFFFASLESQTELNQKVIIFDDPLTSLDEHRALTTVQEIRRLGEIAGQVVVLSHSKSFLCSLWEGADTNARSAMKISRADQTSTFENWDVNQDCITEHDRRHSLVYQYIQNGFGINEREVAVALRPILESFIRVACPQYFGPGDLLGPFLGICQQREGTPAQILTPQDRVELRQLLDYANRFHHDTNPAWHITTINNLELLHFAQRTLNFACK
ncbi:MAG: AAA family ATPase [Rhodospirillaceae bacterium]|nr:AAA family ATPase [Rhodospirillaceae bacterium]